MESFEYDQEQSNNLVARFRLETNIESVELRRRRFYLESQQRNAMFFETRCINMKKSENPIHDRCDFLNNLQFNPRLLHTDWNQSYNSNRFGKLL